MKYSPSMSENYFIGVHERELARLREQHAAWEPETRALWDAAGFGPAQHIADLGSGPGFSSIDLAQLVGPEGRVAALDKAFPYLEFLRAQAGARNIGNIDTRVADLAQIERIEGALDGAFCRFFLAFVAADLDRVLQCVYRSLRPGGALAAMEYLTLGSTTCAPPIRGFDAHTQAWIRYYAKNGADASIGARLPARLAAAGFTIEYRHCVGGLAGPGHRWWKWWGRLIADFGEKLAADGLMARGELRDLRDDWEKLSGEQTPFIHTPILIQLVARKAPAAQA